MLPKHTTNYRTDCSLGHAEIVSDSLLRHSAFSKFADLLDLGFRETRRWINLSGGTAFRSGAAPQSFWMSPRTVPIPSGAPAFAGAIFSILLVCAREQMRPIAAWPIITGMTRHQWPWVFTAGQKQRNPIRVETSPFAFKFDVEASIPYIKTLPDPRPARINAASFIDTRPKSPDVIFRKIGYWSSLVISHIASCKAVWLEPGRMFSHPSGSFYFNISGSF